MSQPSTTRESPRVCVADLIAQPPDVHGGVTYALTRGALEWIEGLATPLRTLETGCGLSTFVFAARGDRHICIVPSPGEPAAVRAYCEQRGIPVDGLTFHVERSELVLPTLETDALDLVLIDGSHAFPQVFVDYMYAGPLLAVGGRLIVDDVHLWTGRVLHNFLVAEPEWRLLHVWDGRTAAFQKTAESPVRDWYEQRFVMRRSTPWLSRARMARSMVRHGDMATLSAYACSMLARR